MSIQTCVLHGTDVHTCAQSTRAAWFHSVSLQLILNDVCLSLILIPWWARSWVPKVLYPVYTHTSFFRRIHCLWFLLIPTLHILPFSILLVQRDLLTSNAIQDQLWLSLTLPFGILHRHLLPLRALALVFTLGHFCCGMLIRPPLKSCCFGSLHLATFRRAKHLQGFPK